MTAFVPPAGPRHGRLLRVALLSGALAGFAETARAQAGADPVPAGAIALPGIDVQGRSTGALADTQGFVSRRDATGTKTDTPLNEIPQSVSVINREQLDSRQVQSLGEALRYTAGVQSEAFGADPHVDWFNIRGFSTNDTGLYLNGLRVSPGVTALAPEPYGLERIDVLKGPASVLYGQNAPGGLVNLVSKRPTDTPLRERPRSWAAATGASKGNSTSAIPWVRTASGPTASPGWRAAPARRLTACRTTGCSWRPRSPTGRVPTRR